MLKILPVVLVLILFAPTGVAQEQAPPAAPFLVIVHPTNPITSVSPSFLEDVFLKHTTHWDNGDPIVPVDLDPDSAVRRRFTENILERSVAAVRSYWQQIIFSGRGVPPVELDGDEAAVLFVSLNPGAIAYVSPSANVDGTKVLTVR